MRALSVHARRWVLLGSLAVTGCTEGAETGAPCTRDAECASGLVCDVPGGEGHCAPATATRPAIDDVPVPAGGVSMGCDPAADDACEEAEAPPHEVTVPAFRIDRTEVTVAAYAAFLSGTGGVCAGGACLAAFGELPVDEVDEGVWTAAPGLASRPMTLVTWFGADAYCAWRGQALCTEAQWERAARGDDGRRYPWGDEAPTCDRAHMSTDAPGCGTGELADVGGRAAGAGPFGALDLAGNAWEWVADSWHDDYTGAPTDGTAWVDAGAKLRVIRGGGAASDAPFLRAAHRWNGGAGDSHALRGFRCCRAAR